MTTTMTPRAAYDQVRETAESIRNDEATTIPVMSHGDVIVQGDVYIACLDRAPARKSDYAGRQLAPGSTQGSRHVLEGDAALFTPDPGDAKEVLNRLIPATRAFEPFLGPVIVAHAPVTITHPEHGDRTLPAGTYQVTYQAAWAEELRRQED